MRAWLACAVIVLFSTTAHGETSIQLRIAWGGGAPQQWSATVALTEGRLLLHRPLGIEADEPGSIWVEENRLQIRGRSPREYDGVDVFVEEASLDASLLVSITADPRLPPVNQEIRLADLIQKPFARPLDERNNRLLVRRAPGDMLQVRLPRDSLVFACDEHVAINVKPNFLPVADGASVRIKSRLVAKTSGEELWAQTSDVTKSAIDSTSPPFVSLDLNMPAAEGVYDLILEASERNPLRPWHKPVATRHVQFVVLSDQPAPHATARATWTRVFEIDPANPGWADRLKSLSRMPGWRQGPLGNGHSQIRQHTLGTVVQLGPANSVHDRAWEAYPLEISKPGAPHLLEVEFPNDVTQTLGISIVEPNAAGHVTPIGLDSGTYTSASAPAAPLGWNKHRLVFWPRTKSPLLILSNLGNGESAAYGKIRVLAGPARLPPAFVPAFDRSERLFAAYLDRPLFNENFGATESLDAWSGRSLDDWQTFYEGATRLVEYLNHAGYNGLLLAVLADGSTIYPSHLLEPSPRFDTGSFFDSGQDPYRKDGLELLLRLFDREGNKLIPALQFSAPLPRLEWLARKSDPQTSGIVLVGADGREWTAGRTPHRELAPYYNPLNPQVQEAMLTVVREIVQRYGHHPAFGGLALQLSAHGYAQLPGEAWGFDDATIAAYQRDKNVTVPGAGVDRFAARAGHLLGPERKSWLEWRAEKLADFHFRMQRELLDVRPDALFYLAPTDMLDTPEARRDLSPGLPSRGRVEDVLLTLGIRPGLYRQREGLVFLRPQRITPPGPVAAGALDGELARSSELDRMTRESFLAGSLLWHDPAKFRLASFEAKSPFGKDKTYAWHVSQLSPAGAENRQRFVRSLARLDSEAIFDGGWLLPLGQEDSLATLVATFRRLPAGRFESLTHDEPVTIRGLVRDGFSYFYFVNDSAWPVTVAMQVHSSAGARVDELSGLRRLPSIVRDRWTLALEPYDVLAVRFASPEVKLAQFVVTPNDAVHAELQRRIDELSHRLAILESPPQLAGPKNPGFETAIRGQPGNWTLTAAPPDSAAARVERRQGYQGTNAVRLESTGQAATFLSEPFAAPKTGRLSLSVRLRADSAAEQPTLRLSVEGTHDDATYNPFAMVGGGTGGVPIPGDWATSQFILKIEDVPAGGLSDLRVRFDLIGPGAVWIDDIQLYHLEFSPTERFQLARLLGLAALQLGRGRWGECQQELDGYWPRFLTDNVPLERQSQAAAREPAPATASDKQATRPRAIERMKDWWKR